MHSTAEHNDEDVTGDRATVASKCVLTQLLSSMPRKTSDPISQSKETFFYLAYGSNLCDETFLGKRGVKPLSSTNVVVPELRMTFDLPGIPYTEPCFANSAKRDTKGQREPASVAADMSEKAPLLGSGFSAATEYNKDKWKKGLVGVVYQVTASDYAHIIATEGGGSSYQDVLVDCYPLEIDQSAPVPWNPNNKPFKAHTLFAPAVPVGEEPPKDGGRFRRPDPSYAQASARYLKLITVGAVERKLPYEYQEYLNSLQPYTITTQKQRLGQFVIGMLWLPFIMFIFSLQRQFSDDKGIAPPWLRRLASAVFRAVWDSYDLFFKALFGDGERTVDEKDERAPFQHKSVEEGGENTSSSVTSDDEKAPINQRA